jgi:hypothetical protein
MERATILHRWSPGGRVLYFASDRDGFTCLHAAAEQAGNLGVSYRGFGVAKDKLVLTIERRAGNIWLLE